MSEPTDEPDLGLSALGDEARQVLAAMQEWAQRGRTQHGATQHGATQHGATRGGDGGQPGGIGGSTCQWCPLCQFAAILRAEHPEFAERLAETGAAVADAVRALVEAAASRAGAAAGRPARRPRPAPRPGPLAAMPRPRPVPRTDVDATPSAGTP